MSVVVRTLGIMNGVNVVTPRENTINNMLLIRLITYAKEEFYKYNKAVKDCEDQILKELKLLEEKD